MLVLLSAASNGVGSQQRHDESIAATQQISPTLANLYRLAWQRHPLFAAQTERQSQYVNSSQLAESVLAAAPVGDLSHRSDGLNVDSPRSGVREWEFVVSLPLALGDRKRLAIETAQQQLSVYEADLLKAQWLLAGEVREAYWNWQLAHIEHQLAEDEVARAQTLAKDSERRTLAGEAARVDTLQAQSSLGLARVQLAESLHKESQALALLQRLTGDGIFASTSETALSQYQVETLQTDRLSSHPWLSSAQSQFQFSKIKLNTALSVRGDAPLLGVSLSRETSNASSALTTGRISLSLPLGTNKRYAPKIAEASADAIESEIIFLRSTEQLAQDIALAKTALQTASQKKQIAQARAASSTEAAQLFAKAFALGELDMPTRLRAEAERAAAVLAMNRAVIEYAAAVSKFNQLLGYLPS
jgi:outer membrane protein, heavy metal efflux system